MSDDVLAEYWEMAAKAEVMRQREAQLTTHITGPSQWESTAARLAAEVERQRAEAREDRELIGNAAREIERQRAVIDEYMADDIAEIGALRASLKECADRLAKSDVSIDRELVERTRAALRRDHAV